MDLRKIIEKIFEGINTRGAFCTQKKSSFLGGSHGKLVLALIPMGDIFELFFSLMSKEKINKTYVVTKVYVFIDVK